MNPLIPLPVAIPFLGAAFILCASPVISRRVADLLSMAVTLSVFALCVVLLFEVGKEPIVYWFGGWRPQGGIAVGISFFADPFSVALTAFVALIACGSLLFSWHYFDSVGILFHTLTLAFVGSMAGFALSGDLFTLFVFFELMSTTAYALTGYKIEKSPLAGSLNFAVTNSIGGFMFLLAIALLYGRTGALNLAQIGAAVAGTQPDGLLVLAFLLIACSFLIKAALFPFHFWLADAYAVAPTPFAVLFSGVMTELGLYGLARVYWVIFEGTFTARSGILTAILISMGAFTAIFGAIMCSLQRHLRRMLAFSSMSHMGVLLIGIACFTPTGLGGSALYLVSNGMLKGALFIVVGVILRDCSSVDEIEARGKGKGSPVAGIVFCVGGLALTGLPPFGIYAGKSLIEEALAPLGYSWVTAVFFVASILTGGTILRAAGRVFLGWGATEGEEASSPSEEESQETDAGAGGRTPVVMIAPAVLFLIMSLLWGLTPNLPHRAEIAAAGFQDRQAYTAATLRGYLEERKNPPLPSRGHSTSGIVYGVASALGAALLALAALFRNRLPRLPSRRIGRAIDAVVCGLQDLHSGHVGDYVAWLVFGAGFLSGLFFLLLL